MVVAGAIALACAAGAAAVNAADAPARPAADAPVRPAADAPARPAADAPVRPSDTPVRPADAPASAIEAPPRATPEASRDEPAGVPMEAKLREQLVAAAVEFSDRPRPGSPLPALLALEPEAFAREVCQDPNLPCDNVFAAYDPTRVRVLYRKSLDLTKVWERSFVVHELVHWLQHQADPDTRADPSCQTYRAAEREAYTAQNRYLRHHQSGRRAGTMLAMLHCDK